MKNTTMNQSQKDSSFQCAVLRYMQRRAINTRLLFHTNVYELWKGKYAPIFEVGGDFIK